MNHVSLDIGGHLYDVPLNLCLISALEDDFGSLISVLQKIQSSELPTRDMVCFIETALKTSQKKIDAMAFEKLIASKGVSGLTEQMIRLLSPMVAGISVLQDLSTGENSLGKSGAHRDIV